MLLRLFSAVLAIAALVGSVDFARAQADNERFMMLGGGAPRAKNYNFFGFGGTDTLTSIEGVYGSKFADTIRGDAGADRLDGGAPGLPRILAMYDALEEWLADASRGCGFVNAHAEIAGTDHPGLAAEVAALASDERAEWLEKA